MPNMKYTVKDSVFTYLFKQPEYTRKLYLTLHPEDQEVTEEDCKVLTLENILTNGMHNDLGFQVRGKLIFLIEAQSTFSLNIVLRLLLYLAMTYKEYIEEHMLDIYSTTTVFVPRPELYVLYTGDQKDIPDTLYLSEMYEGGGDAELKVHVLRDKGTNSIIDQYVRFCKIADVQRKKYGRTNKAIEKTIQICIEQGILVPFLESRQKEVHDIMSLLFDQDTIMRIHDYNVEQKGMAKGMEKGMAQGMEKGMAQGMEEGREKGIQALISSMRKLSIDKEIVIKQLIEEFSLTKDAASEKANRYWIQ